MRQQSIKVFHVEHFSILLSQPPAKRSVTRETHALPAQTRSALSVPRGTLRGGHDFHKTLPLISPTRSHILTRNTQKIKSCDVSSRLPTRRLASARRQLPSTLPPHSPLPRAPLCCST